MDCAQSDTEELICLYYEAFNAGDRGGMLRLLTPEVVHERSEGITTNGLAEFERFLIQRGRCYTEQVEDLVVMVDESGLRAAAEFYISGTYRVTEAGLPEAAGQKYHLRVGVFFVLDGGRIQRMTTYHNRQEWIRQIEE